MVMEEHPEKLNVAVPAVSFVVTAWLALILYSELEVFSSSLSFTFFVTLA